MPTKTRQQRRRSRFEVITFDTSFRLFIQSSKLVTRTAPTSRHRDCPWRVCVRVCFPTMTTLSDRDVEKHVWYFSQCLRLLPHQYDSLDANRMTAVRTACYRGCVAKAMISWMTAFCAGVLLLDGTGCVGSLGGCVQCRSKGQVHRLDLQSPSSP